MNLSIMFNLQRKSTATMVAGFSGDHVTQYNLSGKSSGRMSANAQNTDFRGNTIRRSTHGAGKGWIDMNRDRFHGIWKQFSGKLKEEWGTLANNPFTASVGTRERIAGRRQEQRGISKQEADRQLEDFMIRNRGWQDLTGH